MIQITDHLYQVQDRVTQALKLAGRPDDKVRIVAVSKQKSADEIRRLYDAGQRDFGESYVQEAIAKQRLLEDCDICWHFIGTVQRNKTRPIAERFEWVHSIDRFQSARRLNDHRPEGAGPLNVLIQVNVSNEPQKSGIALDQVIGLARQISDLPMLDLRGLMAITRAGSSDFEAAQQFSAVRDSAEMLGAYGLRFDTLSMGMSADFESAIASGANCVRIGAAIFGPRHS